MKITAYQKILSAFASLFFPAYKSALKQSLIAAEKTKTTTPLRLESTMLSVISQMSNARFFCHGKK